ncbi:MAG: hypothetical protein ACYC63_15875 [Armatimonadota bacterium]
MHLDNGRLRADFDPRSGALVRVTDTVSGRVHLDALAGERDDGRLFRLVSPRPMCFSRYFDAHEHEPQISATGAGLTIRYPSLTGHGEGQPSGLAAEVVVEPSPAPDELLFTIRLENRSQEVVNEVQCPGLSGWSGPEGSWLFTNGANSQLDPAAMLRFDRRGGGNTYARNTQRMAHLYPVNLYLPWLDLSGPGGGLSTIAYMDQPLNCYLSFENLLSYQPGTRLSFGWAFCVAIQPGETWQSPPVGLAVHDGDWHQTADRYRRWLEPRQQFAPGKRTQGEMIGFQNVFFRGFEGTPIRPLEALPQVAATARKYGVDHLCVWDYLTLGNYSKHDPCDLLDYAGSERQALSDGLHRARAEGSNVCALTNFRHPCVPLVLNDPGLQEQIQRRYDGTARTENWSASHHHGHLFTKHLGPESYVYSPFSQAHRERLLRLADEYADLGYTSIFYDQPFEINPDYGFIGQGGRPELTHHAALELVGEVAAKLRQRDPRALVIGEELCPYASQYVDLWMTWSYCCAASTPRAAMAHYSLPQTMLSWVVDTEPEQASRAFALGLYLCLCVRGNEGTLDDEPVLAAHVAKLAALRKQTAQRTVAGRFMDKLGIAVDADAEVLACSYDSPHGPAVIITAPGAPATAKITLEHAAFSSTKTPGAAALHRLDGTIESNSGDVLELALEADEVVVWLP